MSITTITKAEFDTLPESLKGKFTAEGDTYILHEEDVEGLKKSKAEILAEKKRAEAKIAELEKFKAEYDAKAASEEEEAMKAAGKFKELEERYKAALDNERAEREKTESEWRNTFLSERVKNLLAEKGVRPEMAKYALLDVADQFELNAERQIQIKGGIGDAKEIDGVIAKLREATPDFFKATTQTGGGASGSGNGNGGTSTLAGNPTEKLATIYGNK